MNPVRKPIALSIKASAFIYGRAFTGVASALVLLAGFSPAEAQTRSSHSKNAHARSSIRAVQVKPSSSGEAERWRAKRSSGSACIDVDRIGGAVFVNQRTLDVLLRTGQRYRLTLASACSQLSYYGGFYYEPTQAGKFCAGKDRLIARAGGSCRVTRIAELVRVK